MATEKVFVKRVFSSRVLEMILSTLLTAGALLVLGTAAHAGPATVTGTISIKPGPAKVATNSASLLVTAYYSGDDTTPNNQLKVEWGLNGVDYSLGSQTLAHQASPYTYTITGLSNPNKYQVRITFIDPDGAPAASTYTNLRPYDGLVHNAVTTVSSKWTDGWGTADTNSQYGEFACSTCHTKNTTNAKRLKTPIVSPKAGLGQNFPGSAVAFLDARDGSSHFGNDTGGHTTSSRICEICHTKTVYHRYDTTSQAGGLTHYNQADCTSCHKHSDGFKAGCTDCHGNTATGAMWPDDAPSSTYADRAGAHAVHVQKIGNMIASGNKENSASTTVSHKNATCVYCHPNPGGANANGAGHTVNTTGSPANVADIQLDGFNSGSFKTISGTTDPDGSYNPTIKRCSNIDCHSNGDFTWTWYPDVIPPGQITNLSAASGTEVGTVALTWTPPPNDGTTGPIAYGYEVRYRTDGAVTDANWGTSTVAGGPPSLVRTYTDYPRTQTMAVYGLTPGTTYYFAVKAFDEVATNLSPASNSVSAVAKTDTAVPFFKGLESADPAMSSGKVNLAWSAAKDDSGPITYRIWWAPTTTSINYTLAPNASTSGTTFQATGLSNGVNYYFAVRAEDAKGNRETNTVQKEAIPQAPNEKDWVGTMYYAQLLGSNTCGTDFTYVSGTLTGTLNTTGYPCSSTVRTRIRDVTGTGEKFRWTLPLATKFTQATNITGGNLTLYWRESDEVAGGQGIRVKLGYTTSTATTPAANEFTWFGNVDKTIPPGHRGYFPVGLSTLSGQVPVNGRPAIAIEKITPNTASRLELRYASSRYESFFTQFQQFENARPNAFSVTAPAASSSQKGNVTVSWGAAVDPEGDQVTYDVYGSIDNGVTYPFIIGTRLTGTTTTWNTAKAGIALSSAVTTAKIKVEASDGMNHKEGAVYYDRREALSGTFTINNSVDTTAPSAITDLRAEHRPKIGTVWLYWHSPGDDGKEGNASQYDIRYKLSDPYNAADVIDSEAKWTAATQASAEPVPVDPGQRQGYEVLGLLPDKKYFFAIKTADEAGNWSPLSNSPLSSGGLKCGVCHSTPPDDLATSGTHDEHGYTQTDCAKCHGQEADTFGAAHMDGATKLAWNNPLKGYTNTAVGPFSQSDTSVVYKNQAGTYTTYSDTTGGGGFNNLDPATGDNKDTGTCFSFNQTGVTGCHGTGTPIWGDRNSVNCAMCHGDPARNVNSDPYGRPYEDPTLDSKYAGAKRIVLASPAKDLLGNTTGKAVGQHLRHLNISYRLTGDSCTLCHLGYDHADGTVNVKMDTDLVGAGAQWNPGADAATPGTCTGTSQLRCHGNNAEAPVWNTRTGDDLTGPKLVACNNCHGHEDNNFTEGATTASIADKTATVSGNVTGDGVVKTIPVNSGHTIVAGNRIGKANTYFVVASTTSTSLTFTWAIPTGVNFTTGEVLISRHIPHTIDAGIVRACTYCHVEGHPQGAAPAGDAIVFVPNYPIAGIDFTSGGIHLRKVIGGRTAMNDGSVIDTEAEICWGCHEDNSISEWGTNNDANTGSMAYDYGILHNNAGSWGTRTQVSKWVGAYWDSPNFRFKTAQIQSTHSVNPSVLGPGVDTEDKIRCVYCHDVHDMNLALNDTVSGKPFLRGTWKGNPYKEDGAPGRNEGFRSATTDGKTSYYPYNLDYGAVPRGSTATTQLGGYWIDQNSGYPTASWTLSNSAGICTLCHGSDVNNMDKFGTNDWIGTNGHSNAVIGGSGANKFNVYQPSKRQEGTTYRNPTMGYVGTTGFTLEEWYGLRNYQGGTPGSTTDDTDDTTGNSMGVAPYIWSTDQLKARYAFGEFAWAVDRTDTAVDLLYHRFSCSKCHNPHASRLPRLMITNCLDVSHNKWDDIWAADPDWINGRSDVSIDWSGTPSVGSTTEAQVMPYTGNDVSGNPRNRQFAYAKSAQNCHRYVDTDMSTATDNAQEKGWNKITPWNEDATWYTNN